VVVRSPLLDESLEVRERLGDREAASRCGKIRSEERERDLVAGLRLSPERGDRLLEAKPVMFLQLARAPGGIVDRLPVTGQRDPGVELDRSEDRW